MAKQIRWCLKRVLNYQNRVVFSQTRLLSQNLLLQNTIDKDIPRESEQILESQKRIAYAKNNVDNVRSLSKKKAIIALSKVLCLSKVNAEESINNNPALENLSPFEIRKNYYILRDAQVDIATVMDNIQLLALTSTVLQERIKCLKKINMDINLLIPFMELSTKRLEKVVSTLIYDEEKISCNRVKYLSEKLNSSEVLVCKKILQHISMSRVSFENIIQKTELFLNEGIKPEYIINDLNSYQYSMERLKERITEVKKIGITPIKPWIFRINPEKWRRLVENKDMYDLPLLLKSMSSMFNCDEEKVRELIEKKLLSTSYYKILKVSKLLHANGYTIDDIWLCPNILNRKYETLESHIRMYKEAGLERMSLSSLAFSSKVLKKLIDKRLRGEAMEENKM